MEKDISIIVATYNADLTIERCIKSIISQKSESLEFIIIDGVSQDQTIDIIKKYKTYIDYFVSEPDCGVYDAWNKGILASKGKWIMFLGADDVLLPQSILKYTNFLKSNADFDIISAKASMVDKFGHEICIFGNKYDWSEFRKNMLFSHGTTLHNKKFVKRNGLFNLSYKICSDYEFFMRHGSTINAGYINDVMILFQSGGMSSTIKGQIETFRIRKFYGSCSYLVNCYLTFRRILGILYRNILNVYYESKS